MKKITGWFFIICGVISLPGFFMKLPKAHDGYQLIGMFIGQGLIYYLAYLCLRNKKKINNKENRDISSVDNSANTIQPTNAFESKNKNIPFDLYHELLEKCNPTQFMQPYDSIKVENANTIYSELLNCNPNDTLRIKRIREDAIAKLEIKISTDDFYNYLLGICNPAQFSQHDNYNKEMVSITNKIYPKLLQNKDNIDKLEEIYKECLLNRLIKQDSLKQDKKYDSTNGLLIVIFIIVAFFALISFLIITKENNEEFNNNVIMVPAAEEVEEFEDFDYSEYGRYCGDSADVYYYEKIIDGKTIITGIDNNGVIVYQDTW